MCILAFSGFIDHFKFKDPLARRSSEEFLCFYISLKLLSPLHAFAVDDRKRDEKIKNLECVRTIEVVSFPDPLAFECVLCRQ